MRSSQMMVATALLLVTPVFTAGAETYTVDGTGGGDFTTIQSAVDHATTGDTLLIASGVYLENVVSTDTFLTWIGEGVGSTVLRGVGGTPSLHLPSTDPNTPPQVLIDMTIEKAASAERAVRWHGGHVEFVRCEVVGKTGTTGEPYGSGVFRESVLTELSMESYGSSLIQECDIASARFVGEYYQAPGGGTACQQHYIDSINSRLGSVYLSCAGFESTDDEIGHVDISTWSSCQATGTTFDSVGTDDGTHLNLEQCTVLGDIDLQPEFWLNSGHSWTELRYCTVLGDFLIDGVNDFQYYPFAWVELHHNTFVGDVVHEWHDMDMPICFMRGNIVLGQSVFESFGCEIAFVATYNDFAGGLTHATVAPDSVYGNIYVDPLMCGPALDDFTLQDCSPCVGTAHDGGDMGAYGVGCGCYTAVTPITWGRLKAMYR